MDAEVKVFGLYGPERTYRVPAGDEEEAKRRAKAEYHKEFAGVQGTVQRMEVSFVPLPDEAVTRKTGDAVDARVIRAADAQ